MDHFGFQIVDVRVDFLEGLFCLLRVDAGSIGFEAGGVVDVVDIQNPRNVLLDNLKNFLEDTQRRFGLVLHFGDDLFLEHEAGVEQGLVISNELLFDASPHVVLPLVEVVHVEDVPALHEGCVFGEQHVLHVFEVVFGHLVVHLVLELLEVAQKLALLVQELQLSEEVLFGLLPVFPGAQEGEGHVLARGGRVEDHHLYGRDGSLELVFYDQQDLLLVGLGQVEADVEVVLLLAVRLLEEEHYLFAGFLDLGSGADYGDLLVFLLDVVKGVVYLLERRLPAYPELSNARFSLERGHVVDDGLDLIRVKV